MQLEPGTPDIVALIGDTKTALVKSKLFDYYEVTRPILQVNMIGIIYY